MPDTTTNVEKSELTLETVQTTFSHWFKAANLVVDPYLFDSLDSNLSVPLAWVLSSFPKGRAFAAAFSAEEVAGAVCKAEGVEYDAETGTVRPAIAIPASNRLRVEAAGATGVDDVVAFLGRCGLEASSVTQGEVRDIVWHAYRVL
ncbi:hypothetical protein KIPB_013413 [Kipferlia bialata]|uniref:Uncharacterized protein n=1 Tax=Kipferlia bialata TaxID=797122 RepID=A0A9K3D8I1_9EUKA|nr:hypothetical protein KIPB_013413 [Kipferlia bialata]|eukprot:g13413.t1